MNITMKELPDTAKPYEKCQRFGADVLSDAELLAVLLRTGTTKMNVLELSQTVLKNAGNSVAGLYRMNREDFRKIPGIGPIKATQLECLLVFSKRLLNSTRASLPDFSQASNIAGYYMEEMRHLQEERLYAVFMDGKCRLLHEEVITKGSVNRSIMPVREIFVKALSYQAVYLVLLHNHPSGDPAPSEEDIASTETVAAAGRTLGIPLLDHIIIGDMRFVSLRDRGFIT